MRVLNRYLVTVCQRIMTLAGLTWLVAWSRRTLQSAESSLAALGDPSTL